MYIGRSIDRPYIVYAEERGQVVVMCTCTCTFNSVANWLLCGEPLLLHTMYIVRVLSIN